MTLLFIAQTAWAQMEWREYPSMERGWQRADEFYYPEEAANASIRLGVNFAVYALTH